MEEKRFGSSSDVANIGDRREELIQNEKFFKYKLRYILYGIAGGFFYSSIFDWPIRKLWFGITAFLTSAFCGLEICFLINVMRGNKYYTSDASSVIALQGCFLGILLCALLAYIAYYFRRELEFGLGQNEDRQEELKYLKGRTDFKDINKVMFYIYVLCNSYYIVTVIGHVTIALSVVTSPEELKEAKWQVSPNPIAPYIETEIEFIFLSVGLYLPYIILMYIGICDALFLIAISQEYYLSKALSWISIERFSEKSTIAFENLNERFLNMDETGHVQASDYDKLLETEREHLIENIKSAIFDHQRSLEKLQQILPYMGIKFTFKTFCDVVILFIAITAVHSDAFPLIQKFRAALIVISVIFVWFSDCYVGEIFSDMGEGTLKKVNEIPWYYLDPPRRKVYYIFLCIAQEPIAIQAGGLFKSGMQMFMDVLNISYKYYNFLRSQK